MTTPVTSAETAPGIQFPGDFAHPPDLEPLLGVGLLSVDSGGLVTAWTAQAERVFGWRRGEVIGHPLAATVAVPSQRQRHERDVERVLSGEAPVSERLLQVHARHKGGEEFTVEVALVPVPLGRGYEFGAFVDEVGSREWTADELERLRSEHPAVVEAALQAFGAAGPSEAPAEEARAAGLLVLFRPPALGLGPQGESAAGVGLALGPEIAVEASSAPELAPNAEIAAEPETAPEPTAAVEPEVVPEAAVALEPDPSPEPAVAPPVASEPAPPPTVEPAPTPAASEPAAPRTGPAAPAPGAAPAPEASLAVVSGSPPESISSERVQRTLDEEGFVLSCQPVLDLRTNEVSHFELLMRMTDDRGRLVLPQGFIGVAEQAGLLQAIDRWLVRRAIGLIAEQQQIGRYVRLELALSAPSLDDPELPFAVEQELAATGADPSRLVLGLSEQIASAAVDLAAALGTSLKGMGCHFALREFGSSFAAMRHLKQLPLDYLKLDGGLIAGLADSRADQLVLKAVVDIAEGIGADTVAELVSDERTLVLLRKAGVSYAQGYHVGPPRRVSDAWGSPGG